jgi:hypothetical protein
MARTIAYAVAAVAAVVILWLIFWAVLHTLLVGFWIALVVLLGFGLYRIGRWSGGRSQE